MHEESPEEIPDRSRVTLGALALCLYALLFLGAWMALYRQMILLPPIFIFFMLDHPMAPAVVAVVVCAIDYARKRTPARLLFLLIALGLVALTATHTVPRAPWEDERAGYRRSLE